MLDNLLDPDDYPQCPICLAELIIKGDRWFMEKKCTNPACDFYECIDNLP